MDHDEMLLCGKEVALALSQELTAATIALPKPTEKLPEPLYALVTNAFAWWVKRIPQQILEHFQRLLKAIVANPKQRLSTLSLSTGLKSSPLTSSQAKGQGDGASQQAQGGGQQDLVDDIRAYSNLTNNQLLRHRDLCLRNYETLVQLGFQAADLHCEQYVLAEKSMQNFRRRFSAE